MIKGNEIHSHGIKIVLLGIVRFLSLEHSNYYNLIVCYVQFRSEIWYLLEKLFTVTVIADKCCRYSFSYISL